MNKWVVFVGGIVVGLLAIAGWRLVSYHSLAVHYHANFAVYVTGQREPFTADSYYEGTTHCYADEASEPAERAHMHNHVSDLVHVHAAAITWGQFFANLGWAIGPTYLQTRDKLLVADSAHHLTYLLNGQAVANPSELVIKSLDKLLVSYGTARGAQLQTQFQSISDSAQQANTSPDPATCGGAAQPDWQVRLQHIFE